MPRKKKSRTLTETSEKKSSVKESINDSGHSVSENTRHRNLRKIPNKPEDEDEALARKEYRSCEKSGCPARRPLCYANVTNKCAGNGYTSRWYHVSESEHFCNECFEYYYRSYKDGYNDYCDWKKNWMISAKSEPSVKAYMSDEVFPYWVQCTKCDKWRQLPHDATISSDYILEYVCGIELEDPKESQDFCGVPEDKVVSQVKNPAWHQSLISAPFLKNSPAAVFLGAYFPEGVGISPSCSQYMASTALYQEKRKKKENSSKDIKHNRTSEEIETDSLTENIPGLSQYLYPFYQPDEHGKAMCIRPDVMEADEVNEFPEYSKNQGSYLGTRNVIIALWNLNFKKWLTLRDVTSQIICRGLGRVHCILLAEGLLHFFTRKALINFGFVEPPKNFSLLPSDKKVSVIIIGSGISGLSAACQLKRFGFDVTVLEANNRIGGRIWDDASMGTSVGKGAQIITGVINNPLIILCEQAHLPFRIMRDKCDLYNAKGRIVNSEIDKKMDKHFNDMLEAVAEWKNTEVDDLPLHEKLMELSRLDYEKRGEKLSKEELSLLEFYISNLEYACGSSLNDVSSIHWDQNEEFPQFAGAHALLPDGYSGIIKKLAKNLSIKLNTSVVSIDYSFDDKVKVKTNSGSLYANKVISTIPLALLQRETVDFKPPLPENKVNAIKSLGSGLIEKVALQFPHRFWNKVVVDADMFGYVPFCTSEKGLFGVFYDMTPQNKEEGPHVLMTCVTGDALKFVKQNSETEIIRYCTKVLRSIVAEQNVDVPEPINFFVSNWRNNPYSYMAYSYVKVGCTGEAYDLMAEDVEKKLFFAGEATNRHFPQTVTGAFLSGLREANKITQVFSKSS